MVKRFIVPDIHGCAKTLKELLKTLLPFSPELYFIGDYINKGPDSKGVLDTLFDLQAQGTRTFFLRGNHEQRFLEAFHDKVIYNEWYENGGKETLESFHVANINLIPAKYVNFINSLPFYFELTDCFIVHAGFNFSCSYTFDDTDAMMNTRDFKADSSVTRGKKIYHGHVPTPIGSVIEKLNDKSLSAFPLDAGCVYYKQREGMGVLLALEINTHQIIVQPFCD